MSGKITQEQWLNDREITASTGWLYFHPHYSERKNALLIHSQINRIPWHEVFFDEPKTLKLIERAVELVRLFADEDIVVMQMKWLNELDLVAKRRFFQINESIGDITSLARSIISQLPVVVRNRLNGYIVLGNVQTVMRSIKGGSMQIQQAVREAEIAIQARAIRDIFGNPGVNPQPAIHSDWLSKDNGTVTSIAHAIYEELTFQQLPILADALEDIGCADEYLLGHLRSPDSHVRGCWALDLILGKK